MKLKATLCVLFQLPIIGRSATECSEDGLAEFLSNPLYMDYLPTATSATIDCKTGLDLDPEYECDWSEPTEKCDAMDGRFFVLSKKVVCPDGTTLTLYPHCIPETCNISEVMDGLSDTLLSDVDSTCDGEVLLLSGIVTPGGTSQPSVTPVEIPGEPTTNGGRMKDSILSLATGLISWAFMY